MLYLVLICAFFNLFMMLLSFGKTNNLRWLQLHMKLHKAKCFETFWFLEVLSRGQELQGV